MSTSDAKQRRKWKMSEESRKKGKKEEIAFVWCKEAASKMECVDV